MPSYLSVASAAGNAVGSYNVTKPASVGDGTLLLAGQATISGTLAQMGTPTGGGWELLRSRDEGGGSPHSKLWWKICGGSEPANYGFSQDSGTNGLAIIVAVSDAATEAPQHALATSGFGTDIVTPSLTPLGDADLDVRFGFGFIGFGSFVLSCTPPATYTERADLQTAISVPAVGTAATRQLASSAAAGSHTFTASTDLDHDHGYTVLVTKPTALAPRRPVWTNVPAMRASRW